MSSKYVYCLFFTDTLVTCQYFASGENAWGSLTLLFTIMPSVVIQFFSIRWYQMDEDLSPAKWIIHVLQLGPLYRYIIVLQTGLEAKKSKDLLDFDLLYHQQSDVCMLRLFESFMESAPQVVLQLYIMIATNEENFFTGISATVSLVSLCWAIAVYSRIHRRVREDKKVVSWPGVVLQAVWRIGMISSRVVALVLFATVFKAYVFLVIGIHWLVMFFWVFLQETDFSSTWLEERLFNAVIAIIYIFCFFNLKEGTSRYRVFVFYTVIFVENVGFLMLWHSSPEAERDIYTEIGFSIVFGGFFIGVTCMILYYRYLHPHSSVGCCSTAKTNHQPCLQHEDVVNHSKGLEAEISPRSHTPSPCSDFIVNQQSPLAIPVSQFTTPVSRPLSAKSSRLLESITDADYVDKRFSEGHSKPQYGRNVGPQRAKSESCLCLEDSVFEGNLSVARSAQGLISSLSKDTKQLGDWMEQYAKERKIFTKNVLDALKIGKDGVSSTEQIVKDMEKKATLSTTNLTSNPHDRKHEQKPQAILRVDSVSKRLLKGNADRKMHRSFRRQLKFEEKSENNSEGQKKDTALIGSAKHEHKSSGDHYKLPVDNVKAKAMVFENLSINNSGLIQSPLKERAKKVTENEMNNVPTNKELKATSLLVKDKQVCDYNNDRLSSELVKSKQHSSPSKHISVNSSVRLETAKINKENKPQVSIKREPITESESMSGYQQPTGQDKMMDCNPCEQQEPPTLELGHMSDQKQSQQTEENATTKLSGQDSIYSQKRPLKRGVSSDMQTFNSSDLRRKSPLGEIQQKASLTPGKMSKQVVSGKENIYLKKKPRKSFGQVNIEDIKESIANSPKKELIKSRRSVSRIPTDIVSNTVSRFTGTPEKK
ncbi:XK-related protein 6 [Holothuria leucospilota]|uniref:XK-related protein n=1 Tax=Holothuria leucospilota TaxID=206669 RepID=A0A9Q1BWM0_HOLLE|nr:XK-related protein 6 [Holothuria leucospilota]